MGKLAQFDINLNVGSNVYYAGQVVQGHINIVLNEPKKVRGIRIKLMGMAKVHWTERKTTGSGNNRHQTTVHYIAEEEYVKNELLLFGQWPQQGSDKVELPAGQTTYPFQFVLPPNLPSSFEGHYGYVRYWLKATLDQPWKFDSTTKLAFTVICLLDLNREPTALTALQGHDEKTLCCWCCKSGPISAFIRIDRGGFVPGEAIPLNIEITNNSNRKVDYSKVSFKMETTYHAHHKKKHQYKTLAKIRHSSIDEGGSDIWSGEQLVIPPIPPSFLTGCRIIDIRYVLQFSVSPSGPATDLDIPLEIIIGTIPLHHIVQQFPPLPPLQPSAPLPPIPGAPADAPTGPPPSYSDCVFGKVNIKEEEDNDYTGGKLDFTPQYTYYNWGHQTTTLPTDED